MESWFKSLKVECVYRKKSELRVLVFEYIEVWDNLKRRRSALDYCSPRAKRSIKLNVLSFRKYFTFFREARYHITFKKAVITFLFGIRACNLNCVTVRLD